MPKIKYPAATLYNASQYPASYVVYVQGSTIYAQSCVAGGTNFSGIDAATVINNALATLTTGGLVFIKRGVYTINAPLNLLGLNNLTIMGESAAYSTAGNAGTLLQLGNGVNDSLFKKLENADTYAYLTIANMFLYGNAANQTGGYAIQLTHSIDVRIHDVAVKNFFSGGIISTANALNTWIRDCSVSSCLGDGITVGSGAAHCIIEGNEIFSNGGNGITRYGSERGTRIVGNDVYLNAQDGIQLTDDLIEPYVVDNDIHSNNTAGGHHGIYLLGANVGSPMHSPFVSGNVFYSNGGGGIGLYCPNWVDGMRVFGNRFDTENLAIETQGVVNNSIIRDNQFVSCGTNLSIADVNYVLKKNIGNVTENSGSSIGTGAQQTIAHGCAFTPTYNQVQLSERSTGASLAYQSAGPDATNIYITAIALKDYNWKVTYNP